MANLKPHRFTKEDQRKGGKISGVKRLNISNINAVMQNYLDDQFLKDGLAMSFAEDILSISPKDRLNFLMAWMPYERPKLATVEQIIEVSGDLSITREQRAERIMELASKIKPSK